MWRQLEQLECYVLVRIDKTNEVRRSSGFNLESLRILFKVPQRYWDYNMKELIDFLDRKIDDLKKDLKEDIQQATGDMEKKIHILTKAIVGIKRQQHSDQIEKAKWIGAGLAMSFLGGVAFQLILAFIQRN